jgi:hypothetical protein
MLLTKELLKRFAHVGDQDGRGDEAEIVAHFFNPWGAGDWYATEYDPGTQMFFGYVNFNDPMFAELGYFSLPELAHAEVGPGGSLRLERDSHWRVRTVGDIKREIGR